MIRTINIEDLERVMEIWLKTNLSGHRFINPNDWHDHFDRTKEMIPSAIKFYVREGFVFQKEQVDDNTNELESIMAWVK